MPDWGSQIMCSTNLLINLFPWSHNQPISCSSSVWWELRVAFLHSLSLTITHFPWGKQTYDETLHFLWWLENKIQYINFCSNAMPCSNVIPCHHFIEIRPNVQSIHFHTSTVLLQLQTLFLTVNSKMSY